MIRFLPAGITPSRCVILSQPRSVPGRWRSTSDGRATHRGKHDLKELEAITRESLDRLYNFQHSDGGWGWWKEGDSDHFMTAYVLWGMTLAHQAGIDVKQDVAERAAKFLDKELVEEEVNYDAQAWMLHALAVYHNSEQKPDRQGVEVSKFQTTAFENLWTNRDRLNAYTRALLALTAHNFGYEDKAKTLVENLENGVKRDSRGISIVRRKVNTSDPSVLGTAHWGEDGVYWRGRWRVSKLRGCTAGSAGHDPKNKLIEPEQWLIKKCRGRMSNTRDTHVVPR